MKFRVKGLLCLIYCYQYDNIVLLPRDLFNPIINDKGFVGTLLTNHSHYDRWKMNLYRAYECLCFLIVKYCQVK